MSTQPVRILHVLGRLGMGGAESRILDLYRHIDREKVQFDFLVHTEAKSGSTDSDSLMKIRKKEYYDDEVRSLGARIYCLPRFTGTNLSQYKKACTAFFAEHHDFAAVEGHMTSMAAVYLPIAKKAGVPVTIAHARSAGVDAGIRGIATRFFRRNLADRCDLCFSCSREASLSVFGKKAVDDGRVILVPNAIDVRSFSFDEKKRAAVRKEFGIPENAFVVGHVGRFDAVKNQKFLAGVCREAAGKAPERPLCALFAGEGNLIPQTKEAFAAAGMGERAFFPGRCDRERTAAFYQAFDAFLFPSLYEGLPGTVLEAQSAGLSCLISDVITDEVCLTDSVRRLPLSDESAWADALAALMRENRTDRGETSKKNIAALADAGFDVVSAAKKMETFYLACQDGTGRAESALPSGGGSPV